MWSRTLTMTAEQLLKAIWTVNHIAQLYLNTIYHF